MPDEKDVKSQQINVEFNEKEAEGIYSNLVLITHSPAEFIMDFTRVLPGIPKARVYSRIITTPQHAKMFLKALKENIERFEKKFGEIKIERTPTPHFGFSNIEKPDKIN
ncbi:MAG: DUF3467 domain-containing protein [Ignavibacteriales bacterium]|nr:DUF3467 domain-containing protein [Ignavibacteriales bacterium]